MLLFLSGVKPTSDAVRPPARKKTDSHDEGGGDFEANAVISFLTNSIKSQAICKTNLGARPLTHDARNFSAQSKHTLYAASMGQR